MEMTRLLGAGTAGRREREPGVKAPTLTSTAGGAAARYGDNRQPQSILAPFPSYPVVPFAALLGPVDHFSALVFFLARR